jgi:predicted nucleic acid-binding protein
MTYIVDTGILVDHLRDESAATKCLEDALRTGRRVAGSVLTRVELRRDVNPHALAAVEAVERLLDWVAVDHEIAALAQTHAERFGRSHPDIDPVDYVIGATAERLDAELLTVSSDRFPMFPNLVAPY